MCRLTTLEKEKIILKEFHRLLRSGKDLSTRSMYEDAGKKAYFEGPTAGKYIRKYYQETITDEMKAFKSENKSLKFETLLKLFCEKFKFCKREGRLILGYIR